MTVVSRPAPLSMTLIERRASKGVFVPPSQTILFTLLPRAASLEGATVPVSLFVTPRLVGEPLLGAFPDWLNWTRQVQQNGLSVTIECAGQSLTLPVDPAALRPELWEALFNAETPVRSYEFDDHSQRGIHSYPFRKALALLKDTYQQVGVELALPDPLPPRREGGLRGRGMLRGALQGLAVNWDAEKARAWPARTRLTTAALAGIRGNPNIGVWLDDQQQRDAEGLPPQPFPPGDQNSARGRFVEHFAAFHHMPAPPALADDEAVDHSQTLDFHRALSSLNTYGELQRALGLVFDLELPREFVPLTPDLATPGTLTLAGVTPGWEWGVPTSVPPLATAYAHFQLAEENHLWCAWSRGLADERLADHVLGMLTLSPAMYGLAQVDVDGGLLKATLLAETLLNPEHEPAPARHSQVFDDTATLPSLRSGGISLFGDMRALRLLAAFRESKRFDDALANPAAPQPRPFQADDLVRGYRLDVWDSFTQQWHSLHQRSGTYQIGPELFATEREEGFVQLGATKAAPGAPNGGEDFYLHEAIARWTGWSLSAPLPGKALSRFADPDRAVPQEGDPAYDTNLPVTQFPLTVSYRVLQGTLPRLKFGRAYRFRARLVDLAGNSLLPDSPLAALLDDLVTLPKRTNLHPGHVVYLRYEPVPAPVLVPRDAQALTGPGSGLERLVIRSFNSDPSLDTIAPDLTAGDRHIAPPRATVDMAEKLGMFDDGAGRVNGDPAVWDMIRTRDGAEFNRPPEPVVLAGQVQDFPLEPGEQLAGVPYIPDLLARGAALRDLPGTPHVSVGRARPNEGAPGPLAYETIADTNPRPGSATLVSYGGDADWQQSAPFRLVLDDGDDPPEWDPSARVLTVRLPKGRTAVTPLSSYVSAEDLKLMGVWQWLRERIEQLSTKEATRQRLHEGETVDRLAHILQRVVEGGHWMLTPPLLLTLVHAVQQPLGLPEFRAVSTDHDGAAQARALAANPGARFLQTAPSPGRQAAEEGAALTAWRHPGSTEAYLLGGLRVHGASTAKVELFAAWTDPVDDPDASEPTTVAHTSPVDTLELNELEEGELIAPGPDWRRNGYYDPEHDTIVFGRAFDRIGIVPTHTQLDRDTAPRHALDDSRRHRVRYTAVATSRYREYFDQNAGLDFTRTSTAVEVDVPASARPAAPGVAYVVPTFAWQRHSATNVKRSVRFGGGLRVYLNRGWYSSGEGELLGVVVRASSGPFDREAWKPFVTQWGSDPIWQTGRLGHVPVRFDFDGYAATDDHLSLEERLPLEGRQQGRVSVVGYPVQYDDERRLWFADITLNTDGSSYTPFVRLALARYQPHALADAKLSRVVLADFAQLTPDRSLVVTSDPYDPRRLKLTLSGVAPRGPRPFVHAEPQPPEPAQHPTEVTVRVQARAADFVSDLAWSDVPDGTVALSEDRRAASDPELLVWTGTLAWTGDIPVPGQLRLLVEEREYVAASYVEVEEREEGRVVRQPGRLIYAEAVELDEALLANALGR
jgi:hypothetical protein